MLEKRADAGSRQQGGRNKRRRNVCAGTPRPSARRSHSVKGARAYYRTIEVKPVAPLPRTWRPPWVRACACVRCRRPQAKVSNQVTARRRPRPPATAGTGRRPRLLPPSATLRHACGRAGRACAADSASHGAPPRPCLLKKKRSPDLDTRDCRPAASRSGPCGLCVRCMHASSLAPCTDRPSFRHADRRVHPRTRRARAACARGRARTLVRCARCARCARSPRGGARAPAARGGTLREGVAPEVGAAVLTDRAEWRQRGDQRVRECVHGR